MQVMIKGLCLGVSQRQGCEGQGVDRDEFEGDKEVLDGEGQGLEGQGYNGVEFEGDTEGQDCERQGKGGQGQVYKESEYMNVNESENVNVNESENVNVNESENLNVNESENVNVNCNESKNITGWLRDKGKRKLYEQYLNESSSEFDDSSDEDYVQPIIDGRRIGSDCDDEEDLESLPGSDEEPQKKCPVFKDSTSLKSLNLVAGMKFKDAKQFREVLRDWCVRNGYDIEFTKNETSRITATCKVDGCEWRIHASPIMKGPTFQIKTLKGNHTCARTYENSLAKATYLATRMESSIRDHPDIPIQQLKNRILRKCNVEVSRFKVLRAKKKALEAIRGGLGTSKWSFISDRQKGLIEALKELVPDSEHSTSFEPLKPPAMKKQRGRPKKLRRRGPDELSQSKRSLPEEIPQGSQAPPTSQEQATEQVRKRDPKEEVTYKGPRNAAYWSQ
ncbi:UNVERIFIED_CONTAM: hypothetical protein Sradi_6126000 [Sesamum radiatum]|uniref:Transposase MuDR plant domain-containing protein n=1 Tax=Sesamum radiatum TaxID=300843 RepID=A0AAW2KLQ5_SESRA